MRTDHQILHHEARVAFEARRHSAASPTLTVRSSSTVSFDRVLPLGRFRSPEPPGGFGSVPRSMPLGFDVRPTRPALQPRNLVPQRRHHSLQLDHLLPLLDNQALQLGVRQAVKIRWRRHAQNKSDSRQLVNRIIIPPTHCRDCNHSPGGGGEA